MVTVALIGASSGMGLTMLKTFINQNKDNKHKIVLLSRSEQPESSAQGVDVRPVDYNNHEQLVKALNGVHTALSVIGGSPQAIRDAQLALIPACKEAGVKRFAPSEYAGNSNEGIDLYAGKKQVWEATKSSGLEYTSFSCGVFMSILATGTPKPLTEVGEREGRKTGEEEALAGLRPWNYVVNMKAGTGDFPGDGTAPLCFTDMRNISLFVYRALDLEKWPETLGMRGDVKSFKEIVEISEKIQGRKWLTKTNSVEELEGKVDDPGKKFYNQTRLRFHQGLGMVGDDLNQKFPDIKPITCEEFIQKWWGGVELPAATWGEDVSFM
jgi:hypothetical protein